MRVQVLPRHIAFGVPCVEEHCPVALAILDALKDEDVDMHVFVGCEYVTVCYPDGREKRWNLPWEITELIDEYDSTGVMYPFSFELPDDQARLGADLGVIPGDIHSPAWDVAIPDFGDDRDGGITEESREMVALHS